MKNTINILSENVINQIAAGEVIQRPASIVKELIENSIDARAKNIQIIIYDAGKTLIQVIDDGLGMNSNDALICFQKHTTSKIKTTEDILKIMTMGFRGEALASIASVANVELKSKTIKEKIGTFINIDNSKIKKNQKIATQTGTSISVKNLFFNIPARKNFLKSDKIEMRHILETFTQLAISNYEVSFKFNNNGKTLYNIENTNLKKRIIQLFGKRYNEKILPIEEITNIVSIKGFLGNPLDAKKTRGEQFLYVNNRFIKSTYLNHAIHSAMDNIITKNQYPSYFIFLNTSPSLVDINIHPNKIDVKFEDEKSIYQILKSACKKSIGMYNITPSLDFTSEQSFEIPSYVQKRPPIEPKLKINTNFNPFSESNLKQNKNEQDIEQLTLQEDINQFFLKDVMNINLYYAVFTVSRNNQHVFYVIDKKRAIERITYEETYQNLKTKQNIRQNTIKPYKISINKIDLQLLKEYKNQIISLGYNINKIDEDSIEINSTPIGIETSNLKTIIDFVLEQLKNKATDINVEFLKQTSKQITYNKYSKDMLIPLANNNGLIIIINKLLNCDTPFIGIDGNPCLIEIDPSKLFK